MVVIEGRGKRGKLGPFTLTTCLVAAVSMVLILTAAEGLASNPARSVNPLSSFTITAPYNGSTTSISGGSSGLGCGNFTSLHSSFNLSNGTGGFEDSISVFTCKGNTTDSETTDDGIQVTVNIPYYTAFPTITAKFNYSVKGDLALSLGNCTVKKNAGTGTCGGYASFGLGGSTYFEDLNSSKLHHTLSTTPYPSLSDDTGVGISCTHSGGCTTTGYGGTPGPFSYTGSFTQVFTPPQKMIKTHKYVLVWDIKCGMYADVGNSHAKLTRSSASVSENSWALGNGVTLSSVVET
jgi:hypothetical protein